MADQKISQLNELTSPLTGDTLPIVNSGETKKITVSNLLSSNTGSFATTGSNTFVGNQIISGSITSTSIINIQNILHLDAIESLPTGSTLGDIAVSGSNLYFHTDSSWMKVMLEPVITSTSTPTPEPTSTPTPEPTGTPTSEPTSTPTLTPSPTDTPTPTPI